MPPRLTQAEFLGRARRVHGDRYDYSESEYLLWTLPVRIICRVHGPFEQIAGTHLSLRGHGCDRCADDASADRTRRRDFVQQASLVHRDRGYDYSHTVYRSRNECVTIVCPAHGAFEQIAKVHLEGGICQTCKRDSMSFDTAAFVERACAVHGDRYDYSPTIYTRWREHVIIRCPKHGPFHQRPREHVTDRHGCPQCGVDSHRSTQDEWVERARVVHGDRYDYSRTEYINGRTKVTIICPAHGPFDKKPGEHLRGAGCPVEARQQRWETRRAAQR